MSDLFLLYFIIVPFIGLLISNFPNKSNEKAIYAVSLITIWLHFTGLLVCAGAYLLGGGEPYYAHVLSYYHKGHSNLSFDLYFDNISLVYGLVSTIISLMVIRFSRYYLHRDKGYKRFFNNVLFFFGGLNVVIFAGNFETIIIGWEILGISSFFLIGYYRLRYLPVKNAMKVVSLYRLSDILMLLAVWMCHLAFDKNINFIELANTSGWAEKLAENNLYFFVVPFLFLLIATIKSAQFPFSSWLTRAMEGPTTSSAIFYGAVAVHIGIFLLLRVEPLWQDKISFRIFLGLLGLLTSIIATNIASVQSTVKTQIAYSSIAQIGIMFIEVALGWHTLVLIHFAGNAFLRAYQLLVSPSMLNYLIHDQYFNFERPEEKAWIIVAQKIRYSVFMLSVKEFNMDQFQFSFLWKPFKLLGNSTRFLSRTAGFVMIGAVLILSATALYSPWHNKIDAYDSSASLILGIFSIFLVLQSFTERKSVFRAWLFLVLTQVVIVLAAGFNDSLSPGESLFYLSGVFVAGGIGHYCLHKLNKEEPIHDLEGYYGHIYEHPKLGLGFLFSGLAISGFPISPTFVGLDILYSNMHKGEFLLPLSIAVSLVFLEISAIRLYSRVYLGPHVKLYHPVAFRSS
jgi:NADH-quinone oxidoreductase subunit L